MSMSRELRDRWATALEDPSRVQGTKALCTVSIDGTRRQCCLDVLVDLYREDHPEGSDGALVVATDEGMVSYLSQDGTFGPEFAMLPLPVARWAGVSYAPRIGNVPATTLNDEYRKTFPEIAALIRESEVR